MIEKLNTKKTIKGTEKQLINYNCGWCQNSFSKYVSKTVTNRKDSKGGVSTQIVCPKCHNFLKTW